MKYLLWSRITTWVLCVCSSWMLSMASSSGSNDDVASNEYQSDCGLYIATSTIPGAGLGLFAGKSHKRRHRVIDGDIAIPLIEMEWHNDGQDYHFIWDDYVWGPSQITGMTQETESGSDLHVAIPGLGAAINCLFPLNNVEDSWVTVDNSGLHRSVDAGAGAITPYHDRQGIAIRDIAAGEELFMSYGTGYFKSRTQTYGLIPIFEEDFEKANGIVHKFVALQEQLSEHNALFKHLWNLTSTMVYSRAFNALPKNYSDLPYVAEKGTEYLHYNRSIQSLDWLQEHGKCADNIRPGRSTIPQAGRGAFATRLVKEGQVVAPCPLIHIPDKSRLNMYAEQHDGARNKSHVVHQQLLLNYCFGHENSTMLLSPYGVLTSLINHSLEKYNTKIVWSSTQRHPEWMNHSVEQMTTHGHAGLALDFVATRDIHQGEEVLLNYGQAWEDAWRAHMEKWEPPEDAYKYQVSYELNLLENVLWPYDEHPYYPSSLEIYVQDLYLEYSGVTLNRNRKVDYVMVRIEGHFSHEKKHYYNVQVIDRNVGEETCEEIPKYIVFGLPRSAFVFEDVPYTRDHYLVSSFRHEIMVPDELFPEAWKNL